MNIAGRKLLKTIVGQVILVTLILGFASFACWGQSCATPPASIVSWWRAEGDATDQIGFDNGTLIGGTAFTTGEVGQGFLFNGSLQGVLLGNPTNLQLQNFTIECWIQRASTTVTSGSGGGGIVFGYGQDGYNFYLSNGGSPGLSKTAIDAVLSSGSLINDLNFHHLAVTKSGNTVVFYVDGAASSPATYDSKFSFDTSVAIGMQGDNQNNSFLGTIDELAVYSGALTPSDIQAIYNAGPAGKCQAFSILSQPTSQFAFVGQTATFKVTAIGLPPLTYQWSENGANINNATDASLVLGNVQINQSGNIYSVLVGDGSGAFTNSSNAVLTVNLLPACVPPPVGLVSWWSGEGNALDEISGNDGVPTNSPSYGQGEVGSGFVFNGSNQGIVLGNPPNLQLQNLTIEAWVSRSSPLVTSGAGGGGVIFGYGQNGYNFYLSNGGAPGFSKTAVDAVLSTGPTVTDTSLHHLAVTKSGNTVIFYVDGIASTPITYNSVFGFSSPVAIGMQGDNANNSFLGTIDELSVYERALTAAEIQSIYNAAAAGKCIGPVAPVIEVQPQGRSVNPGANITLSVVAAGSSPLSYQWQFGNSNLDGATNSALVMNNIQPNDSGNYALIVSNVVGSVTSLVALVKVKVVTILANNQQPTSNQYSSSNSVNITMQSFYTNGDIFYTLDGSIPTAGSTLYTGPFSVTQSSIIQTLGYSPDFSQSAVSDPVTISIVPFYTLVTSTAGGGKIAVIPTNNVQYANNTIVKLTAVPSNGWSFLQWTGDLGGSGVSNTVLMNRNKSIQAIFGTVVTNSVGGHGTVTFNPIGGRYPFGATIQASALPQAGNAFIVWGNAATGTTNPLSFKVTNANPVISALFNSLSAGQASLTVVPVGHGHVLTAPQANSYATNASVSVTATPDAGQTFKGWSGDASGNQNPLTVLTTTNKLIYANFSTNNNLSAHLTSGGFADGFQVDLNGEFGLHYRLDGSSNLVDWIPLLTATNSTGTIHYIDTNAVNFSNRFYRFETVP